VPSGPHTVLALYKEKIMTQLRTIDAAALAHLSRALIGFDRIFNNIESRGTNSNINYPPFNIIKFDDTHYEIEIAVAGFAKTDIAVEVDQDQLIIKGYKPEIEINDSQYIHRGLAARNFERAFTIPQYMEVGEVSLTNGILHVKLTLIVPEALKPRRIEVK
jgi:molecular chaperone IbpA